jgi:hypothetical protein
MIRFITEFSIINISKLTKDKNFGRLGHILTISNSNKLKNTRKFIALSLLFSSLLLVTLSENAISTSVLGGAINVSDNTSDSSAPQIHVDSPNVYTVWKDFATGNGDVYFERSTNDASSFVSATINLSSNSGVSSSPQISSSGVNVYSVWDDTEAGSGDIFFKRSEDSGATFPFSTTNLSNTSGSSSSAQIAAAGQNVYVVWQDFTTGNFDIYFKRSIDDGATFSDLPINLSDSNPGPSTAPQIAVSGTNVYVVWHDRTTGNGDIYFIRSTDSGATFPGPIINVSDSISSSGNPQIAVSGNNVFVVWTDPTGDDQDVLFKRSTNDGESFTEPIVNLSNSSIASIDPQIATSGTNVYVAWEETTGSLDGEIYFTQSTTSGSSFSSSINLSENDGNSVDQVLAASGTNVYVAWEDNSFGGSSGTEVLLRTSVDSGANFDAFQDLSSNSGLSLSPQLDVSGNNLYVAWQDNSDGDNDVLVRAGATSSVKIEFDSFQYNIGSSPTITITDSSLIDGNSDDTINISLSSTSGTPISLDLNENGDTGVFSGSFILISDISATPNLHVDAGDIITATYGLESGSASVFPITVSFNHNEYDFGTIAHLTVIDKNADTTSSQDTVDVLVTSGFNSTGITLTLTETGANTGIFGGDPSLVSPAPGSNLIFMLGNNIAEPDSLATISVVDATENSGSLLVTVTSSSDETGFSVTLNEDRNNSGVFSGTINLSSTASNPSTNTLLAVGGDIVSVTDNSGEFTSNGFVSPNPDGADGAIEVNYNPPDVSSDTVTVTYQTISDSALVNDQGAGGGGGGGLVRPSLVVNALAGFGAAGGGSAYSSPTLQLSNLVKLGQLDVPSEVEQMIYDHDSTIPAPAMDLGYFENFDYPMIINDKGFVLSGYSTTIETQSLETNTPHTIKFMYYEADKIQHFSLYTNLRDANTAIHQSDTQILYFDGQEIEVIDPNGFFQDVSFTLNEIDDLKKEIVLEITFANEMDTSDIILRSWDPYLNSFDTYILDAITVVSDEIIESPITTYDEPVIEKLQSSSIPIWIKNNAAWWSEQQIGDSDFVAGIEYLIKNGIINVPGVQVSTSSTTEIPDWIKNNASWWSDSLITDGDFIEAMQWLVANGVIQI